MKNLTIIVQLLGYFLFFSTSITAQTILKPTLADHHLQMDGIGYQLEWQSDVKVKVPQAGGDSTSFTLKYDSDYLYILAEGNLESSFMFPEVLLSAKWDTSTTWKQREDWFFHVSATDCESDSTYGDFSNCDTTQTGWQALPNFQIGPPNTDGVEIAISLDKIGYDSTFQDTLAICFMVSNTSTQFHSFPLSSVRTNPSSWAKVVLSKPTASIAEGTDNPIRLYPNPAREKLVITGVSSGARIMVFDLTGNCVKQEILSNQNTISLQNLTSGLYLVKVTQNGLQKKEKVLVY